MVAVVVVLAPCEHLGIRIAFVSVGASALVLSCKTRQEVVGVGMRNENHAWLRL